MFTLPPEMGIRSEQAAGQVKTYYENLIYFRFKLI